MMNFGETLAYWYFRLNGFFPLANFVLHRSPNVVEHSADSDLLAVRFPHVYEETGGKPEDWDNDRFDGWGLRHQDSVVCAIVEVKTGRSDRSAGSRAFSEDRLRVAVRRFGVLPQKDVDPLVARLVSCAVVAGPNSTFAKIFITPNLKKTASSGEPLAWCDLSLKEIVAFIQSRMLDYRSRKQADRMFFSNDLIQYLAWQESHQ